MPGRLAATALPCLATLLALTGCAAATDAPRLHYQCAQALPFEARLYRDMAIIEGLRGHVVLARVRTNNAPEPATPAAPAAASGQPDTPPTETHTATADATDDNDDRQPRYADETVHAHFGLGQGGRLVRLDYSGIPRPVFCERLTPPTAPGQQTGNGTDAPVRAHPRAGPRNPPPFNPNAPVQTNWRTSDGQDSQGEGGTLRP